MSLWFGHQVAPSDFSYLWLREGFATLFGLRIANLDLRYGTQNMMENLVQEKCQNVKVTDALRETRPMTFEVYDRDSINAVYDNIAFDKCKYILKDFIPVH